MDEITIEAVSPFGFKVGTGWLNFDKKSGIKKEDYHAGDVVALTKNPAGFITSVKVVTAGTGAKKSYGGSTGVPAGDTSLRIARSVAVKSVFGLEVVDHMFSEKSEEEAMAYSFGLCETIVKYLEKGI